MIDLSHCPACGGPLIEHHEATEKFNEWWDYDCGAQIVNVNGTLEDNDHCRDALEVALRRLQEK